MFDELPAELVKRTFIKFDYLNPTRTDDDTIISVSNGRYYQSSLKGVLDFSMNFNSVNFLLGGKYDYSPFAVAPISTVYTRNIPDQSCDYVKTPEIFQYWLTAPVNDWDFSSEDQMFHKKTNFIPLRSTFTETNDRCYTTNFRAYATFNFGENGNDKYTPELLYTTKTEYSVFDETQTEFYFSIPDFSPPIPMSGDDPTLDFVKFGAIANTRSDNSDSIVWRDSNGFLKTSWLRNKNGIGCGSGEWVDTYKSDVLTHVPTELVLLSGVEYQYVRPLITTDDEINNSIQKTDAIVYKFGGVVGSEVVDDSSFNNDGMII